MVGLWVILSYEQTKIGIVLGNVGVLDVQLWLKSKNTALLLLQYPLNSTISSDIVSE